MNGFSLLRIVYMQLAVLSNSSANFYECSDVIFALGAVDVFRVRELTVRMNVIGQ